MKSFSKNLDNQVKKISNGLKQIGIAAVAVVTGLGVLTKSAINANDELSKLSTKLGISTEDLSALKFAGDFAGVSLGNLDGALSALTRRFNNFDKTGGGAGKDSFIELGIATRDAEGNLRNINDVFIEISEKVSKMGAGIRKTAIVQDIFSKSQAKIIPLLNEGAEGLDAFRRQAESMGLILDQKTAKASEAFNDKLSVLSKLASGVAAKLAEKLLPTLISVTDELVRFATSQDFKKALESIRLIVNGLIVAFQGIILAIKGALIVTNVLAKNFGKAEKGADGFLKTLESLKKRIRDFGKEPELEIVLTGRENTGKTLPGTPSDNIEDEKNKVKTFLEQIKDFYKTLTDLNTQFASAFKNAFNGLEDALLDFTKTGKFNFKDLADSIISDIARIAIRQAIIAPLVGAATSAISGFFTTSGTQGTQVAGARALGGPVTGRDSFLVGEQGPEIFTPNQSGRIIPNNRTNQIMNQGGANGGGMNRSDVSITINAVDTQTGISFLISHKDTIASIFNQSLNSNGSIRTNL